MPQAGDFDTVAIPLVKRDKARAVGAPEALMDWFLASVEKGDRSARDSSK
jgi:hypothetical protein